MPYVDDMWGDIIFSVMIFLAIPIVVILSAFPNLILGVIPDIGPNIDPNIILTESALSFRKYTN